MNSPSPYSPYSPQGLSVPYGDSPSPKKSLWKQWWFWLLLVLLIPVLFFVVLFIYFLLNPDFADEETKEEAFQTYVCRTSLDSSQDQQGQARSVAIGVLADKSSSSAERRTALDIVSHNMGADAISTVPLTVSPDNDRSCYGWVYEHMLEQRKDKEYVDFTYQDAEDAGIFK